MYKIKFMFDWGSGICMWSADKKTEEKFGDYPIETDLLPISEKLIDTLNKLIDWHDEALNWESPSEDLIWDDNQIQQFLMAEKVHIMIYVMSWEMIMKLLFMNVCDY